MFYSCKESNTVFHTVKLWTPFRTVTDFKRHLVSSHKDVDKTCIFSGCEWSCVNSNTYQSHLARSHGKTGQATVKPQFIICVGSIILEDDVSGNPEDEDLHDGLDPASTSDSSESEAEEDFSHVDSQIQIRCYAGLFSTPKFQFFGKPRKPSESEAAFLKSGDLVTDSVSVWGTTYKVGHVVVTSVICPDILEVGIIEKVVVRGSQARFQVSLHDCARDSNNIFQSIPKNTGKLVPHSSLADFKPIFKRGTGKSFRFVLHHYLPVTNITT